MKRCDKCNEMKDKTKILCQGCIDDIYQDANWESWGEDN